MPKFASRAVTALITYVESNLQTYLTAVEVDEGLAAGSLEAPICFVKGLTPRDNTSPLCMVYSEGGDPEEIREGIYMIDCRIAIAFNGTNDIPLGHQQLDQYVTALIDMIRADYTLGSAARVVQALPGRFDTVLAALSDSDTSETHHVLVLEVEVTVDEGC